MKMLDEELDDICKGYFNGSDMEIYDRRDLRNLCRDLIRQAYTEGVILTENTDKTNTISLNELLRKKFGR